MVCQPVENEACGDRETSLVVFYGHCSTWLVQLCHHVTALLCYLMKTASCMCLSLISPQTCDLFEEAAAPSVNTRKGTQQQSKSQRVNVAFSLLPCMLSVINGVCVANCTASLAFTCRWPWRKCQWRNVITSLDLTGK